MKKIQCIILILALSVSGCAKKEKAKSISGRLRNAENSWIYLQKITEHAEQNIDSVMTERDGSFQMANKVTEPDFYILRANDRNVVFLFLKPGDNVEINGDAKKLEETYKVRGSKDSELIQLLRSKDKLLSDSLDKEYEMRRAENPEAKDSIGLALQREYATTMENYAKEFIRKNITSIVSLSATKFLNQQAELALMNELKDSLIKTYTAENRYVKDYVTLINELNLLPPGSQCPEINLQTPDGKTLALSSLRGKIVLIDFWASWCVPCRRENPHLLEVYKKYKGNDFEIYGVSLDENVAAWKNAVEKDQLTWPQVSDLKKWESIVVKEFHIEAIPYGILIDREGKIIAKGIRIEELELKITEAINKRSL
jgi:thiol-disulfide isomerase/thioredoxin